MPYKACRQKGVYSFIKHILCESLCYSSWGLCHKVWTRCSVGLTLSWLDEFIYVQNSCTSENKQEKNYWQRRVRFSFLTRTFGIIKFIQHIGLCLFPQATYTQRQRVPVLSSGSLSIFLCHIRKFSQLQICKIYILLSVKIIYYLKF